VTKSKQGKKGGDVANWVKQTGGLEGQGGTIGVIGDGKIARGG